MLALQRASECARVIDLKHFAHDPPKCERFGDKIMPFYYFATILERDRTQNRLPLLLIALYQTGFHFAGNCLCASSSLQSAD
jgi:hypothetical protein